ncbi:hypothetical protein AYO49_02990 [Verrucomicrobiaceae bacterium SCGC AG-212-N21]|nr:hypothetical protein AYO49_02990 [Verrucomicrobiaceae bacterium SCGC AG-212-N21]
MWTIAFELAGSFLVYAICICFSGQPLLRRSVCILLLIFPQLPGFIVRDSPHQLFVIGLLLADLEVPRRVARFPRASLVVLILGLYLGGYSETKGNPFYGWLPVPPSGSFWNPVHSTGAILTFMGVCGTPMVARLLSNRTCAALGTLSYAIYTVHALILHGIVWNALSVMDARFDPALAMGLTFVLYIALTMGASAVMLKYVDQPSIEGGERLARALVKTSKVEPTASLP